MNKIYFLCVIFLINSLQIKSQGIVNRSSASVTAQDARLSAQFNFLLPKYQDTASANNITSIGLDSCGALIYSRVDSSIYMRVCAPIKFWKKVNGTSGGGGSTNVNIGSGYRWAVPGTNNIKTSFAGFGIIKDSTTNTNGITDKVDSSKLKTVYQARQDSIALVAAIALKLNISDTASMLTNYRNGINSNAANLLLKLNISDTAGMLTNYRNGINTNAANILLKQNLVTLTTTGSSGASTFNQSTGALNIPTYAGTTYSAGLGLLLTGTTFKLDTSYGKKYFTWGLLVPNDSTVLVDSSKVASLLALQDSSAALRALSGGGGSVANPTASVGLTAVNGTATSAIRSDGAPALSQSIIPTWTGLHTFQKTATTPGGSSSILFGILSKPSFTASLTGDTLAGIVSQPVFTNTAFRYSFYGTSYDALINGVSIGGGNNNNIASQNTAIGFQAGLAFNNAATSANTAIGNVAGRAITSGFINTLIGYAAGTLLTTGTYNTVIGGNAMASTGTGRNNNTVIGATAGNALTGDQNCIIGNDAGRSAGSGNIMLGYQAGYLFAVSNRLYIQNSNSATPLIGGDFSVRSAGVNKAGYTAAWHLPSGTSTAGSAPLKFSYDSLTTTATTGSAGIATVSFASQAFAPFAVGSTIVVAGVTPSGYNATATVTACTTTSVSYSNATTASQTVAGRVVQGQLMTAVENGAIEYDGADYYGSSASTRYKIAKTSTTGSNANMGTATLSGGTITVSTTAVTATSKIFLTDATTGALTNIGTPTVGTITAGTSFVINSSNVLDASNVNWIIFN